VDLKVFLEARQRGRSVKILVVKPVQLLVDVLLWKDEHLEFLRLHKVRTLGNLLDKHAQEVAAFLKEIFGAVSETLLFGQRRNVQSGQSLYKAVS